MLTPSVRRLGTANTARSKRVCPQIKTLPDVWTLQRHSAKSCHISEFHKEAVFSLFAYDPLGLTAHKSLARETDFRSIFIQMSEI